MDEQQFLQFASKIGVMKPATVDEDKDGQLKKLQDCLLSNDYAAEEKIDGCHYLCIGCRFLSTEGVEKTNNYPHLRDFFLHLDMPNLILDGETNYPGKTSQYCTRVTGSGADVAISFQNTNGAIHYTMWDMLRTPKGTWLLSTPYWKRRQILEQFYAQFIKGSSMESFIHLTDCRLKDKKAFYEDLIAAGREGAVLKRLDSLYIMGKKPMWQWMKLKQKDTADFFISSFEDPKILYEGNNIADWPYWKEIKGVSRPVTKYYYNNWIGAMELSAFVNGQVTKICTCSGINEELRQQLSNNPTAYINRVVKISFMEKTEAGYPRHPRFEQFHESKTAKECTWVLNEQGG
jgi:hypothetical protein